MRMHYPLCVLLVALPAFVTAVQSYCIVGCKCDGDVLNTRNLNIKDCDSPLILTNNTLQSISKKITTIGFKNVVIKRIANNAFAGFDELQVVIIEDSSIGSVDSSAFDLPELGTINFIKTTFAENPSISSEYLEELIFNDCKLSEVPNLKNVPALNFVNLANNLIKEIDESTFQNVDSLEEVTLSNNSISKLPPDLFVNNRDFNTLNLDYNPLETFDLNFGSDMEFLSLRYCKLSSFDRSSSEKLKSLTNLDLGGNQIAVLPIDAFEPMKDLNFLDLSNNKLVELDDDIFLENSKLDRIILDNNQLATLPNFQTKANTFQTYTFSCKNCGLKSAKAFDNMKGLITVDLSNNKIADIEGVFSEMHGLKALFLSNNEIATIGVNSFSKNSELETLDLSNNPLLPLDPVVFATLPSLKKLNISHCDLLQLWSNQNANLPSLERLFLSDNQLTILTVEDVKILPELKIMELDHNPLMCTDELKDLVNYFLQKSIYPKDTVLFKTHEEIQSGTDETHSPRRSWQNVVGLNCAWDPFDKEDLENELIDEDEDEDGDDDDDLNYVMDYSNESKQDIAVEESILDNSGFNLARASYILSITSVFILTALLVLVVAVVVTLLILKRNKSFNMHNGNLPRLKIPLWHTSPGQKKHSGSVYRPLSEELSGSRTPIINRYEFKQTPQVHNSIP